MIGGRSDCDLREPPVTLEGSASRHRSFEIRHVDLLAGPTSGTLGLVSGYLYVLKEVHPVSGEGAPSTLTWDLHVTTPTPVTDLELDTYTLSVWTAEEWRFFGDAVLQRSQPLRHRFTGVGDLHGFDPSFHFG
jgi:hypothetical protein